MTGTASEESVAAAYLVGLTSKVSEEGVEAALCVIGTSRGSEEGVFEASRISLPGTHAGEGVVCSRNTKYAIAADVVLRRGVDRIRRKRCDVEIAGYLNRHRTGTEHHCVAARHLRACANGSGIGNPWRAVGSSADKRVVVLTGIGLSCVEAHKRVVGARRVQSAGSAAKEGVFRASSVVATSEVAEE